MIGVLQEIMMFDDHIDSDKPNSVSVTTLLGSKYKAKLYLAKTKKNPKLVDMKYKRSSFIGTAIHSRAESITKDEPGYIVEQFVEREIELDGITYVIAGSFDGLKLNADAEYNMYDYKSFYGNKRSSEALEKDAMQMSLYRWILEGSRPEIPVSDTAYSICISQSNNYMEEIQVQLTSLDSIQYFIEEKIYQIVNQEMSDCTEGIKYNPCTYCDFECEERAI